MGEISELDVAWDAMYALIPQMRKVVNKALEIDIRTFEHGTPRQQRERKVFRHHFDFLRKKWVFDLLYEIHLLKNPFYADIQKFLSEINSRTLSQRLTELQTLNMISRNVTEHKPPRVFYTLTDYGLGIYELLIPLLSFIAHPNRFVNK